MLTACPRVDILHLLQVFLQCLEPIIHTAGFTTQGLTLPGVAIHLELVVEPGHVLMIHRLDFAVFKDFNHIRAASSQLNLVAPPRTGDSLDDRKAIAIAHLVSVFELRLRGKIFCKAHRHTWSNALQATCSVGLPRAAKSSPFFARTGG